MDEFEDTDNIIVCQVSFISILQPTFEIKEDTNVAPGAKAADDDTDIIWKSYGKMVGQPCLVWATRDHAFPGNRLSCQDGCSMDSKDWPFFQGDLCHSGLGIAADRMALATSDVDMGFQTYSFALAPLLTAHAVLVGLVYWEAQLKPVFQVSKDHTDEKLWVSKL